MNPELFALSASKRLATDYTDLHRLVKKSVAIREIRGKKRLHTRAMKYSPPNKTIFIRYLR
jgi:hypothetical protein